ncbi:MAG: FAD/NAD(P)-binding protein [Bacteroidetes bacterium]|nr:FAD/NAD(P)-binding protein [Bacteroidota bacterium]MCL5738646.1 FAD/NAD(P)-binding protein [Bacteroidota bacterium]
MIETTLENKTEIKSSMVPALATIRRAIWETDDTFTLLIDPPADGNAFAFKPGQFNMVYAFGVGESAISISSDPAKPNMLAHTIHRVGTVTSTLSKLKRGDMIGLRGPFGAGWPVEEAVGKDVCITAGGIGLAPLRPVIYSLVRQREKFGRIIILYGARSPLDLLYRVELEQWSKLPNTEVIVTVDRGDSSWKGHIGVVTNLFSYIKMDSRSTLVMVCGPEVMMKYTVEELQRRGLSQEQIYISMERNMKCGIGLCGHCQFGPKFICKDGPVFRLPEVHHLLDKKEI